MGIYIALLRGINVSGSKPIKMAELKLMFEGLGVSRVQTYIQSGNVLFESGEEAKLLQAQIEQEIQKVFGYDVPVALRTREEMEFIVRQSPFPSDQLSESESLYVALLVDKPVQSGVEKLLAYSDDIDEYRIQGQEIYILCRKGFGKSKFSNNFLESKVGVPATTRNWQTMSKLVKLSGDILA